MMNLNGYDKMQSLYETGRRIEKVIVMVEERKENCSGESLTFKEWERKVDQVLSKECGFSAQDLADYNSWDCWEGEGCPICGAIDCLEAQDMFPEEIIDELRERCENGGP